MDVRLETPAFNTGAYNSGITKLEYYSVHILAGILACPNGPSSRIEAVKLSVEYAKFLHEAIKSEMG